MRNDHWYGALQDSEEVAKSQSSVSFIPDKTLCDKVSRLDHDHAMSQRLVLTAADRKGPRLSLPFSRRLLPSPASNFQVPSGNAGGVEYLLVGYGIG